MDTYDVVVIGAGVNGLVAAAELATAGWSVALVEQNSRLGGFIDSGEATLPGYTHDTYSSWHPLFVSGGAYAALGPDLHEHGLEYANTDGALTGSISAGRAAVAYRDAAKTVEGFTHPEDQAAYLAMLEEMGERANLVFRRGLTLVRGHADSSIGWGSEIMNHGQKELLRGVPPAGGRPV